MRYRDPASTIVAFTIAFVVSLGANAILRLFIHSRSLVTALALVISLIVTALVFAVVAFLPSKPMHTDQHPYFAVTDPYNKQCYECYHYEKNEFMQAMSGTKDSVEPT